MTTMRKLLALGFVAVILAGCSSSGPSDSQLSDLAKFCADLTVAAGAPYSNDHYQTMQRDFPFTTDNNGYEEANRLVDMYQPDAVDGTTVDSTFVYGVQAYESTVCTNP